MLRPRTSVLCIGQLVADIVVRPVDRLPVSGRTNLVEETQLLAGGCSANTAAVLAKFGAEVHLAAVIGQDVMGDAVLANLQAMGVGVETVRREAGLPTSTAIVLVDGAGERSFLYCNGGSERLADGHVPDAALKSARIVHVGGALKLLSLDLKEVMRRAKTFGCLTSLDTDWDVHGNWMRRLEGVLPLVDYFATNQEEAAMLTGQDHPRDAAQALLEAGAGVVIVKRGAAGALLATPTQTLEVPACRVPVRDTTCAGDSFVAGFLFGVHQGSSLEESLRLGNASGALCVTQISHQGVTSLEAVRQLAEGGLQQTPCAISSPGAAG